MHITTLCLVVSDHAAVVSMHLRIDEIDFTAHSTKRKKVMWNDSFVQVSSLQKSLAPPSDEELSCFYEALSKTRKPALLSLHSKYSDSYIVDYSKLSPTCPSHLYLF